MSIDFESRTIKTCVVSVPGKEYDSFKRRVLALDITRWILFLACFAAALIYIFTAITGDTWWYGVIALIAAFVVALIVVVGVDALRQSYATDLAAKHGWRNHYPFIIKPNYQQFVHD
ncbi:MAG: hypothetical protein RLZZ480_430 [Candidatus Parcubacteria bacterium]|jgi:glucan phosphoethanolaminetransferase (alkaline phosphatase superfamily)